MEKIDLLKAGLTYLISQLKDKEYLKIEIDDNDFEIFDAINIVLYYRMNETKIIEDDSNGFYIDLLSKNNSINLYNILIGKRIFIVKDEKRDLEKLISKDNISNEKEKIVELIEKNYNEAKIKLNI